MIVSFQLVLIIKYKIDIYKDRIIKICFLSTFITCRPQ